MAKSAAAAGLVSQLTTARTFPRLLARSRHFQPSLQSLVLYSRPQCKNSSPSLILLQNLKASLTTSRSWSWSWSWSWNWRSTHLARGKMVAAQTKPNSSAQQQQELDDVPATELGYFQDMFALESTATFLALVQDGDRLAVIVDRTILYSQGGGQPCDFGYIFTLDGKVKFRVEDVRSKNGHVYHYGNFDSPEDTSFQRGQEVRLTVDASRRSHNSRLHSAGHLLDACMKTVGLVNLEAGKGHHFPDSPYVEYKGAIPASDIEKKRAELEEEANRLMTTGGVVYSVVTSYEEAAHLCGGSLPAYIPKESTPRIVTVGGLGGPCGGTHVADISEIGSIKVTQIRVKKGMTKVSYTIPAGTD